MTGFHLVILFGLSYVLVIQCEGKVYPPSDGTRLIYLPRSTVRINWTFDDSIGSLSVRVWNFKTGNSDNPHQLGGIPGKGEPTVETTLLDVGIEKPATLVLKNVNQSYNGTYQFSLRPNNDNDGVSQVVVFIAAKPNPMINCSDPTAVIEGYDLACVCGDEEGNPPANLTWYDEDDNQIGNTTYGENILTLTNVTEQDSGRYTCKAQSYTLVDEESFELIVRPNFKPNETEVHFTKNPAILRGSVTVNCSSNGLPEPSYIIMHNDSITVSNKTKYTIPEVKWSDAGTYKCIAKNKLGSDSASKNLTVTEQGQTTKPPTTPTASTSTTEKGGNGTEPTPTTPPTSASTSGSTSASTSSSPDLPTGAIIGIIIGVLALIIIVGVVVYCCKSKEKERSNSCANIDPVPGSSHELGETGPGDGAYDTVWPVETSESKSKPPVENALPPVYAAVDKNNREGNTLYASLDNEALKSSRASKKEPDRPQQTEYASIDFAKTGNAPKAV